MGRFLALWEADDSRLPADPKERGAGYEVALKFIREEMKKGLIKDWGSFVGTTCGFIVYEGTEVEVGIWDPSLPNPHVTDIHVIAGSSETWTVDFTGVFDIVSDTTGWAATIESIPASTSTWW